MQDLPTSGPVPKKGGISNGRKIFWLIVFVFGVYLLFTAIGPSGTEVIPEDAVIDGQVMDQPITNYRVLSLDSWANQERALDDIQSLTEGQEFVGGIVEDPTRLHIVYFATSAYDARNKSNLVSVYAYNNNDYSFERLFRTTYERGNTVGLEERILPTLQVAGYEDERLIVLAHDIDDELETCEHPILIESDDERSLLSLSVIDPYAGFEDYTPERDVIEKAQAEEDRCE